jgi:hypothetical protein
MLVRWAGRRVWLWWVIFLAVSAFEIARMLASPVHNGASSIAIGEVGRDPRLILRFGSWQLYAHGFWLDLLGAVIIAAVTGLFTWLVVGGLRMIIRGMVGIARRLPGSRRRLSAHGRRLGADYRARRLERDHFENPSDAWDPARR